MKRIGLLKNVIKYENSEWQNVVLQTYLFQGISRYISFNVAKNIKVITTRQNLHLNWNKSTWKVLSYYILTFVPYVVDKKLYIFVVNIYMWCLSSFAFPILVFYVDIWAHIITWYLRFRMYTTFCVSIAGREVLESICFRIKMIISPPTMFN